VEKGHRPFISKELPEELRSTIRQVQNTSPRGMFTDLNPYQRLVWHRDLPSKSIILKYNLLLIFQKWRFGFGYQKQVSIWQRGHPPKNSHIGDDLVLIYKNSHINGTTSQGYYCQTKNSQSVGSRVNILYWNIPTGWIFCTGTSLLAEYFALEHPYWLTILYWNILTNGIFCTGTSFLAEYFLLEHS
jgi:hypothetical protein